MSWLKSLATTILHVFSYLATCISSTNSASDYSPCCLDVFASPSHLSCWALDFKTPITVDSSILYRVSIWISLLFPSSQNEIYRPFPSTLENCLTCNSAAHPSNVFIVLPSKHLFSVLAFWPLSDGMTTTSLLIPLNFLFAYLIFIKLNFLLGELNNVASSSYRFVALSIISIFSTLLGLNFCGFNIRNLMQSGCLTLSTHPWLLAFSLHLVIPLWNTFSTDSNCYYRASICYFPLLLFVSILLWFVTELMHSLCFLTLTRSVWMLHVLHVT